jgi:hypothetical protein
MAEASPTGERPRNRWLMGVAHHGDLVDAVTADAGGRRGPADQVVDEAADSAIQSLQSVGLGGGDGDAGDEVVTVLRLRVQIGGDLYHPARGEMDQVEHHGRSPDVHRRAVGLAGGIAGLDQ